MYRVEDRIRRSQGWELVHNGRMAFYNCSLDEAAGRALIRCLRQQANTTTTVAFTELTFHKCTWDPHPDALQAFYEFFHMAATTLQRLVIHTPTLSNSQLGALLQPLSSLAELSMTWSFARAAASERAAVIHAQAQSLQRLHLRYDGLAFFAEWNDDLLTACWPNKLHKLTHLHFQGWNMRNEQLHELMNNIPALPTLQSMTLEDIRGLTIEGLFKNHSIGRSRADEEEHERNKNNLQTAQHDHYYSLQSLQLLHCRTILSQATEEQLSHWIQKSLRVSNLTIRHCHLPRQNLRALLRALPDCHMMIQSITLQDSSFGQAELDVLLDILPRLAPVLRHLEIHQLAIALEDDNDNDNNNDETTTTPHTKRGRLHQLLHALERNTTLTHFVLAGAHGTLDAATNDTLRAILQRNRRARNVQRLVVSSSVKGAQASTSTKVLIPYALWKLAQEAPEGCGDMWQLLEQCVAVITGG